MLDFANFVAINKFDRRGADDALRDVSKQFQRNRQAFGSSPDKMPVFGTVASRFNDDGVTALYQAIAAELTGKGLPLKPGQLRLVSVRASSRATSIAPPARARYLAAVATTGRAYHRHTREQVALARECQQLSATSALLSRECKEDNANIVALLAARERKLDPRAKKLLEMWPDMQKAYSGDEYVV